MANRITDIVTNFANMVKDFAIVATESAKTRKLARALKSVADALGDEGEVYIAQAKLETNDFATAHDALILQDSDFTETGTDLAKMARRVEVYLEDDVLEDADAETARNALALWQEVRPSARPTAVRGPQSEGRTSVPDFDFPIFATCEECGVTVRTGERSGVTDWNSLRHYAQRHAQNAHASRPFGAMVSGAWRNAKASFETGADEIVVEGDADSPGFVLTKQAAA